MSPATRLLTSADVGDPAGDQVSVSARLDVELADGSRVLLLDDRGWASSGRWDTCSVDEVVSTSRMVAGPDEPYGGRSRDDMATAHWDTLARTAQVHGLVATGFELSRLPHDVVLSERLQARVGAHPDVSAD